MPKSAIVCTYGAPILRQKAQPVKTFDASLKALAEEMLEAMYVAKGVGLAAPQFGHSLQLVVIDFRQLDNNTKVQRLDNNTEVLLDGRTVPQALTQPLCFANPTCVPVGQLQDEQEEGCLSLPGICGRVKRFCEVVLHYQDLDGEIHMLRCSDWLARCIQHECDHLRGVLFIDYLSKKAHKEQQERLNQLKALKGQWDYAAKPCDESDQPS